MIVLRSDKSCLSTGYRCGRTINSHNYIPNKHPKKHALSWHVRLSAVVNAFFPARCVYRSRDELHQCYEMLCISQNTAKQKEPLDNVVIHKHFSVSDSIDVARTNKLTTVCGLYE